MSSDSTEEQVIDTEAEVDTEDTTDTTEDTKPTPKQEETPEAKLARLKRMTERLERKLGIAKEEKPTEAKTSAEFDYAQKAFLVANGIKGSKELALVQDAVKATGDSIEDVLENEFFQAKLKKFREQEATDDALPKGTKRSSGPARDTVEYWIAKGELPPADNVDLRRKVVHQKRQIATNSKKFTDIPVAK